MQNLLNALLNALVISFWNMIGALKKPREKYLYSKRSEWI